MPALTSTPIKTPRGQPACAVPRNADTEQAVLGDPSIKTDANQKPLLLLFTVLLSARFSFHTGT